MKVRARSLVLLALVVLASCGRATHDPAGAYTLTLAGPVGPFHGPATVTATPQPALGTVEVDFAIDGTPSGLALGAPFSAELDFSKVWGGPHHVTAVARRDDGTTAEASLDLTYDPFGPSVTVLAPAAGAHAPPEGGVLDVAFHASDPIGLTGGAVQVGDAAPIPIPLPSLSLSVPVPAATDLPAATSLSWWLADAAGNRTEGTVPLVQTHERFSLPLSDTDVTLSMPGGRVVVVSSAEVRAYDADGHVAWSLDAAGVPFAGAMRATGGELFVTRGASKTMMSVQPDVIQRLHADGSVAWQWPASGGSTVYDAVYLPASDSLLGLRQGSGPAGVIVALVDATGHETVVTAPSSASSVSLVTTPAGASPGGFAVVTSTGAVNAHYDIFDASGAPAWSGDFLIAPQPTVLLTRDVVFGPTATQLALQGPGGIVAGLGAVTLFAVAPDGDLLVAAAPPAAIGLAVRFHPDGTVVWQTQLADPVAGLFADGDRVAVSAGPAVRVVDTAGAVIDWNLGPSSDGWLPTSPTVTFSPSGAFYVMGPIQSLNLRIFRAAPDGTTLWHETLYQPGNLVAASPAPDDERLVISVVTVPASTPRARVFEP